MVIAIYLLSERYRIICIVREPPATGHHNASEAKRLRVVAGHAECPGISAICSGVNSCRTCCLADSGRQPTVRTRCSAKQDRRSARLEHEQDADLAGAARSRAEHLQVVNLRCCDGVHPARGPTSGPAQLSGVAARSTVDRLDAVSTLGYSCGSGADRDRARPEVAALPGSGELRPGQGRPCGRCLVDAAERGGGTLRPVARGVTREPSDPIDGEL